MAEVKVYYDRFGNTLTVWFGNPQDEYTCEESEGRVLRVITLEDGETVHNAFFDRNFYRRQQRGEEPQ